MFWGCIALKGETIQTLLNLNPNTFIPIYFQVSHQLTGNIFVQIHKYAPPWFVLSFRYGVSYTSDNKSEEESTLASKCDSVKQITSKSKRRFLTNSNLFRILRIFECIMDKQCSIGPGLLSTFPHSKQ